MFWGRGGGFCVPVVQYMQYMQIRIAYICIHAYTYSYLRIPNCGANKLAHPDRAKQAILSADAGFGQGKHAGTVTRIRLQQVFSTLRTILVARSSFLLQIHSFNVTDR